jgi:hypothetical protein
MQKAENARRLPRDRRFSPAEKRSNFPDFSKEAFSSEK